VGWVTSKDSGNRFGESYLYAGIYEDGEYHGAFQLDLSFLKPGSSIHYAAVELTGLSDRIRGNEGKWTLKMLEPEIDPEWPLHGYQVIHEAPVAHTLAPVLTNKDLGAGNKNIFVLNAAQRAEIEDRILRGVVSFRVDGEPIGTAALFGWDTGYGNETLGNGPVLRIAVSPPESAVTPTVERLAGLGTPTPTFVIVTSVPTPANVLTAAADALTVTAWATRIGTPTPLPPNWVTPVIVTPTPTPANAATATAEAAMANAVALLTGTPTPTPGNVWTATPTPTYMVITPVPTPENALTTVAIALTATEEAATAGTPTPLPPNWVTPIVVTATPTPANEATSTAREAHATAETFLLGTPTPTPDNLWVVTATPTPLFIYLWALPDTGTPTATPTKLPISIQGRIGFISNRRGEEGYYIMDANGDQVALLTNPWAYTFAGSIQQLASDGDGYVSSDGSKIVYHVGRPGNQQIWIRNIDGSNPQNISSNGFDEHDPVWLVNPAPTATATAIAAPTPSPTPQPPSQPPARPRPPTKEVPGM
jgi:hypothetical protein